MTGISLQNQCQMFIPLREKVIPRNKDFVPILSVQILHEDHLRLLTFVTIRKLRVIVCHLSHNKTRKYGRKLTSLVLDELHCQPCLLNLHLQFHHHRWLTTTVVRVAILTSIITSKMPTIILISYLMIIWSRYAKMTKFCGIVIIWRRMFPVVVEAAVTVVPQLLGFVGLHRVFMYGNWSLGTGSVCRLWIFNHRLVWRNRKEFKGKIVF